MPGTCAYPATATGLASCTSVLPTPKILQIRHWPRLVVWATASFLIGDVTNMSRYVSVSTNAKETQKRLFTYMQDSWRLTPKLTVNYGLRWELYFPETVNGKGQGGFPDLNTGEIRVAGFGPFNTAMNVSKTWKTLAPRLGIAYQLNDKTVIRTGYGRSFDIGVFGSIFGHMVTQNLPVLVNQNLTASGVNTAAFNLAVGPTPFVFPTVPSVAYFPFSPETTSKFAMTLTSSLQ